MKKILLCAMMALLTVVNAAAKTTESKPVKGLKVINDKAIVPNVLFGDDMPDGFTGPRDLNLADVQTRKLSKKITASESTYTDEQGVVYALDEGTQTYAVTEYTDDLKNEIIIASEVNGLPVTSIGRLAFYQCYSLTSVTIPESVTLIDYAAFAGTGLRSVTIPNSVTSIGRFAFYQCYRLTSVTIPNSVTLIDYAAFAESALTSVTIPNSVTSMGEYVFTSCYNLTSVTISNSVTSIDYAAFAYCSALTSVTIPNSVTSIGEGAFEGCSGLTSVTIPNSVTSIGKWAFSWCRGLVSIVVESGNPTYDSRNDCNAIIETSSNTLIAGCRNTTIPESVTSIGHGAFGGCTGLTSIVIPESVNIIGESAFNECTGLTSITIPEGVTTIGERAFEDCTGLTSVFVLRKEPIAINENTFRNLAGTDEEGNSIWANKIYESATLYVPNYCTQAYADSEGWKLFADIENMPYIDEQGIIYMLGEDNQYSVKGHTDKLKGEIVIASEVEGKPVTGIANDAFYGCTGLTSISIPASVTYIGREAFYKCNGLKKAGYASIEDLLKIQFEGDYSNPLLYAHHLYINGEEITGSLVIPESVTKIGSSAFLGCTGLTSVTIPESVTVIEDEAFWGCKLRNVFVKSVTPPILNPDDYYYDYDYYDEDDDAAAEVFGDVTCFHGILYVPTGAWEAYAFDSGWWPFINIREAATEQQEVKADIAYTLMDAKTFQYAVYDQVNDRVRMIQSVNVDESNPNHCWQTVTSESKTYLYNIGARKFAVPATDGTGFTLADEVGSIKMEDGRDGIVLNGHTETQWALVSNERMATDLSVEGIVTSVNSVNTSASTIHNVYDASGRQQASPQRGLNILRKADGTTKKVMVK